MFDQRSIATDNGPRAYSDLSFLEPRYRDSSQCRRRSGFTPGGLPIATQIIDPRYEDDTAITFAELSRPRPAGKATRVKTDPTGLNPSADAA